MLSLIVAMDKNRLIGSGNRLPWHLSEDLKRFKAITMNKPIIMGRKTYESIGRPLPGRRNIVVSRNPNFQAEGCECVDDLAKAIDLASNSDEAIVIGGMQIYRLAMPLVQRMYITEIDYSFEGDAWFPEFDDSEWSCIENQTYQHNIEPLKYAYKFMVMERIVR